MASRGSEVQRLSKRDQPINAYVWRDIYSVGDRKQDSVRERNVDGETTYRYTEMDMLDRGTSASLGVGDDRRVVLRVKLYMCVGGHLTACREKHM